MPVFIYLVIAAVSLFGLAFEGRAQVPASEFVNFEGAQTSPIRLSPSGTRLFAVNTPDARVSVFDLADPSNPALIAEIPVGIEPVSVNPRTEDEAWVVNLESDSISIVSVRQGIVVDTLYVKDEPGDVVFAGNHAFVSVSRSNEVRIFDVRTRELVQTIRLLGEHPRGLAVNEDGTKVYTAFLLSGNRTSVAPFFLAPEPQPPTNPDLPPAKQQGQIVDLRNPFWASLLKIWLPDNDVAEIDVQSLSLSRYISGVGTINFALAVRPGSGEVFVANTEANNLIQFEPNLKGKFIDSRVTRISGDIVEPVDLNGEDVSRSTAISQPTAIVFSPDGEQMFIASFGTDRIAVADAQGAILDLIHVNPGEPGDVDPRSMRGPRGLALNWDEKRLYVMNRVSNTISVIDAAANSVLSEIPAGSFDPTPTVIREGRGFLYDAKLAGNGTGSCAGCHVDVDLDFLAWDLGDPGGEMEFAQGVDGPIPMHPMKGPMTTQTLRGLKDLEPFHWRGDRATFADFNPAFEKLMGGSQLSDEDMQAFTDFIMTVVFMPNPHRNLDDTLPARLDGADPIAGRESYFNDLYNSGSNETCNSCHTAEPGPGTNLEVDVIVGRELKVPHLRNVYQKVNIRRGDQQPALSLHGVGLGHDGTAAGMPAFFENVVFDLIQDNTELLLDISAYVKCFDTGTPPAVGYSYTVKRTNLRGRETDEAWNLLEQQAAAGKIDLIVKGSLFGGVRGLLYRPGSDDYQLDEAGAPALTRTQLRWLITNGNTLTLMGVPAGSGQRMGIDRDLNGVLDGDEL